MYNKNPVFAETFIFSTLQKLQQLRENTCLPELNPCTMMVQYPFRGYRTGREVIPEERYGVLKAAMSIKVIFWGLLWRAPQ